MNKNLRKILEDSIYGKEVMIEKLSTINALAEWDENNGTVNIRLTESETISSIALDLVLEAMRETIESIKSDKDTQMGIIRDENLKINKQLISSDEAILYDLLKNNESKWTFDNINHIAMRLFDAKKRNITRKLRLSFEY